MGRFASQGFLSALWLLPGWILLFGVSFVATLELVGGGGPQGEPTLADVLVVAAGSAGLATAVTGYLRRKWGAQAGDRSRRLFFPVLVIGAIVAAIWWLESRDDVGVSPTGERYGPAELPAALRTTGLDVAPEEGSLAPDFLLESLDGGEVRLSDYRGQPVVLNFWATWCAPCRKEIPQFVDAYQRFRGDGLVIIGVNLQEGKSIARGYVQDYGMEFPVAIDVDGEVGDAYRLLGLPVTYFIGREGVVRSVFTGPFEETQRDTEVRGAIEQSELEQRIAAILSTEATP